MVGGPQTGVPTDVPAARRGTPGGGGRHQQTRIGFGSGIGIPQPTLLQSAGGWRRRGRIPETNARAATRVRSRRRTCRRRGTWKHVVAIVTREASVGDAPRSTQGSCSRPGLGPLAPEAAVRFPVLAAAATRPDAREAGASPDARRLRLRAEVGRLPPDRCEGRPWCSRSEPARLEPDDANPGGGYSYPAPMGGGSCGSAGASAVVVVRIVRRRGR